MTAPVSKDPVDTQRRASGGVQPRPKPDVEVGVSSHLPFVVPYKNAWEILRSEEVTVKQLAAMRKTDGQARALYRLITLPIRAALKTATFVPAEDVEGGEEESAFIQQMFTLPATGGGMVVPFGRFVAQLLMAVFDGFSAFEMVYWQPDRGPLKGKYTLKKLAHRPSEQLTFILNDRSEWIGLRQQTMYQNRQIDVTIPADDAVYWAANEEENPYYGQSFFQSAFFHWDKKFKLYVVGHIAAQRAAVGTRVGTMPPNPSREEKAEFTRALAELGVAQYMTIPEGFKVDSLKEFTGFDFLAFINHHNNQMSKSILAAFFDDQQGSGGDASLVDFGRQSDALFMMMLHTIMGEIEEVINNQIIPRFIDWNFDSAKYPRFTFGTLTDEQKAQVVDLFKTLAVAGQSLTVRPELVHELEKQVAELYGLEVDWETVEAEMEREKQQAEQMAQMQMMGDPTLMGDGSPGPGGSEGTPGIPADGATPGAAGAALPVGGVSVDPSLLPEGFALTRPDDDGLVTLNDLAADLLDEAMVSLVRGKPRSGGPKFVRTQQGAATYGVPVGTPITRDMDKKLAAHGQKGKPYGGLGKKPKDKPAAKPASETHGGGPGAKAQNPGTEHGGGTGAKAQNPGGVSTGGGTTATPKRVLSNPKAPGVQLLDFGDGTVAIRDAQGRVSPRQRFSVEQFMKYGWKVDTTADKPADKDKKPAAKKST